ncbi:hypothetical protein HR45_04560 [Shewanella mangrovi]|uniref:Uncharacterized protein n=1 Tax=Shewanella mangrovi TaxID=1515746 RepID=A0A094JKW7_9GAMM|nr:hypothetical protein HR45_04560 [Shewanella mangrovi]
MDIRERYSDIAKVQLSFLSFMTVAIWISLGVGVAFAIGLHLVISHVGSNDDSGVAMFWFYSMMYGFIGFLFSVIGSVISYPVYRLWCKRALGQCLHGHFILMQKH